MDRLRSFNLNGLYVEPSKLRLTYRGHSRLIEPKVMEMLVVLSTRPNQTLLRTELIDLVWGTNFGSDESLSRTISVLRKCLKELGVDDLVTTVPKIGYRLNVTGPISRQETADIDQETRKAPSSKPRHLKLSRKSLAALSLSIGAILFCAAFVWNLKTASPADHASFDETLNWPVPFSETSILVLPFSDMSSPNARSYFSEGFAEDLISALQKVRPLHVVGSRSAFLATTSEDKLSTPSEAANVAYFLDGSVRTIGNKIEIDAHLLDSEKGTIVWSGRFDGAIEDVFELQEDLARQVASKVTANSEDVPGNRLAENQTVSVEAYDLFLRARAGFRQDQSKSAFVAAERLLNEAVSLDPEFTQAWLELATLNRFAAGFIGDRPMSDYANAAREATRQANRLSPEDPHSLISSAYVSYHENDAPRAFKQAQSAWNLQPGNPGIAYSLGHFSANFGYLDKAKDAMEEAVRLDPLDGFNWSMLALVNSSLGNHKTALVQAEHAANLGDVAAYITLAWSNHALGNSEAAEDYSFELLTLNSANDPTFHDLFRAWGRAVFRNSSKDADGLRALLKLQAAQPNFRPDAASINLTAQLGLHEAVFTQWNDAYSAKSTLSMSIWSDFEWARQLRASPEFKDFARTQGWVAIWQEFGWPVHCQPDEATNGESGAFTCR